MYDDVSGEKKYIFLKSKMTKTIGTRLAHFAESQIGLQNFEKAVADFKNATSFKGYIESLAQLDIGISNAFMTIVPGGDETKAFLKGTESTVGRMAIGAKQGLIYRSLKDEAPGVIDAVLRDNKREADLYQHFMIEKISNKSAAGTILDDYHSSVNKMEAIDGVQRNAETEKIMENNFLNVAGSKDIGNTFIAGKGYTTDMTKLQNMRGMKIYHREGCMSPIHQSVVQSLEGKEYVEGERANTFLYTGMKTNLRIMAKKEGKTIEEKEIQRTAFQKLVDHVRDTAPESEYKTHFLQRAKTLQFLDSITVKRIKLGIYVFYYGISMTKSSLSTRYSTQQYQ